MQQFNVLQRPFARLIRRAALQEWYFLFTTGAPLRANANEFFRFGNNGYD
jgi:hypothetical protein